MEVLYLAYNDECDSARANHIRKRLLATGRYQIEGYLPFTTWSKTRLGCSSEEIKRTIDDGLARSVATVVLVGPDAAANPWIRYAIERTYTLKKALLALTINNLTDERGETADLDLNPLERFAVMEGGRKIYLSERYRTYPWDDDDASAFINQLGEAKNSCGARAATQRLSTVPQCKPAEASRALSSTTNFDVANV